MVLRTWTTGCCGGFTDSTEPSSSSSVGAMKLKPLKSWWAPALGGTPGESKIMRKSIYGGEETVALDLLGAIGTRPWRENSVTPNDHQSALWSCPCLFTTSGAMYSTVPQKE
ncbi:hypothetical protein EYF80_045947 [Liparis tanakae]|uniref:Uncharacterized protein n=1 Tax=Liparis tanakae TaxID=230148 RepID=A0A4Z2FSW6_9TELE|nr:hypothetical protein EYF80_045947 [Liparis tanakae]